MPSRNIWDSATFTGFHWYTWAFRPDLDCTYCTGIATIQDLAPKRGVVIRIWRFKTQHLWKVHSRIRSQAYVLAKPDLGQNLLHILVVTCFWYCPRRHPVLTWIIWIGILHYPRIQGQYSAKYASNDYGHKVSNDCGSYGKWLFNGIVMNHHMTSWLSKVSLILDDAGSGAPLGFPAHELRSIGLPQGSHILAVKSASLGKQHEDFA